MEEKKKAIAQNGVIENVDLLFEDHGCLVLNIGIRLQDGGYVTFGNVSLGRKHQKFDHCVSHPGDAYNWAAYYIGRVFDVLDVNSINDIKKGMPVRAIIWDHICIGIQRFMDKEKYYIPREDWPENMEDIDLSGIK